MTINEYQTEALRTAAGMNHPNNDEILLNGVMGLCGESGECVDMVKKYRFQGHELDKAHRGGNHVYSLSHGSFLR